MPYTRHRNNSQSSLGSSQRVVAINSRRASRNPSHLELNALTDDTIESFLAIDYNQELLGGEASVEVVYPSMRTALSQNDHSVAYKSNQMSSASKSHNPNKHMVSTPSTEPMGDSDNDDDDNSFFPYLGRPLSPLSPPRVKHDNGLSLAPPSPVLDGGGCFLDSTFPYLGRLTAAPRDAHLKRLDPDGKLARNLYATDFGALEVSRESVRESPHDSKTRRREDDNQKVVHRGSSDTLLDEDELSIPDSLLTKSEMGGCSTPYFPYLGRRTAHKEQNDTDNDSIPESMLPTPAPSNDSAEEDLVPAMPFFCRGPAPVSPASAHEEKKNDDAEDDNGNARATGCIFGVPLHKQVLDQQQDFDYSVSSAGSQANVADDDEEEPTDEWLDQLHDHVKRCMDAHGSGSTRTGQACLQLGTAYLDAGIKLSLAQQFLVHAYRTFEDKPVARALVLEKMSHVASIQANEDASMLPQVYNLLLESFRLRQDHLGKLHVDTVNTLNQLARFHRRSGNLDESRRLQTQVYYARKQIFGSRHPSCAVAAHDLANVLAQLRQNKDAETLYRMALAIYERMHVPMENPAVSRLIKDFQQLERNNKVASKKSSTPKSRPPPTARPKSRRSVTVSANNRR